MRQKTRRKIDGSLKAKTGGGAMLRRLRGSPAGSEAARQ